MSLYSLLRTKRMASLPVCLSWADGPDEGGPGGRDDDEHAVLHGPLHPGHLRRLNRCLRGEGLQSYAHNAATI